MYYRIRKSLTKIVGSESVVDIISLCTNPNTLLIILMGYDDVDNLKTIESDKNRNTSLISKYCNKIGNKKAYDASKWQLELFKNDYIYSCKASIEKIINGMYKLSSNYKSLNIGSNIIPYIKALIFDDYSFFNTIKDKLKIYNI